LCTMTPNGVWLLLLAFTFAFTTCYNGVVGVNAFLLPPDYNSVQSAAAAAFAQLGIWKGKDNARFRVQDGRLQGGDDDESGKPPRRVPVDLAVMSQCPDARLCEVVWDKVLNAVADKVDLRLIYIGEFDDKAKYGVRCMHGETECDGNVQQLCFRHAYPDLRQWWQFVQCQNFGSRDKIGTIDVARQCAKTIGHDWDEEPGLRECAEGPQGRALLRESVKLGKQMNLEKSCSILINNELVCIHDGRWKQCDLGHEVSDFVREVNEVYDRLN